MVEAHPAEYTEWLSGKGSASNPPGWAWRRTPAGVTVGPNHGKGIALLAAVAALFTGGVVFLAVVGRRGGGPVDGLMEIGRVTVGLGLTAAVVLVAAVVILMIRDQVAGPYLIYRPGRREFDLARAGLVLPGSQVQRWRVVTGNWVGSKNVQVRRPSARSELHLIADGPAGPMAYLVCAWTRATLADPLRELAAATHLPLERVDQPDIEYGDHSARLRDAG